MTNSPAAPADPPPEPVRVTVEAARRGSTHPQEDACRLPCAARYRRSPLGSVPNPAYADAKRIVLTVGAAPPATTEPPTDGTAPPPSGDTTPPPADTAAPPVDSSAPPATGPGRAPAR